MSSQSTRSSKKTKNDRLTSFKRRRVDGPVDPKGLEKERVIDQTLTVGCKKRNHHPSATADDVLAPRKKTEFSMGLRSTTRAKLLDSKPSASPESVSLREDTSLFNELHESSETQLQEVPHTFAPHDETTTKFKLRNEIKSLGLVYSDVFREPRRNLRSKKSHMFKSELSIYFPEYDEVIGNRPGGNITFNIDTPISIVDSANPTKPSLAKKKKKKKKKEDEDPLTDYSDTLVKNLKNAQKVDFSALEWKIGENGSDDTLCDAYFKSIHEQPEKLEKIIRKSERDRAQHEKDHILRLLEGLQGNDWLKVMGVNRVTETTKPDFRPAREHFIRGCKSILAKFRSLEEIERQMRSDRATVPKKEADLMRGKVTEKQDPSESNDGAISVCNKSKAFALSQLDGTTFCMFETDSLAIRKKSDFMGSISPFLPEKIHTPYNLGLNFHAAAPRRKQNSESFPIAWGLPVPDVPQQDFDLPDELRNSETVRIHTRMNRIKQKPIKTESCKIE